MCGHHQRITVLKTVSPEGLVRDNFTIMLFNFICLTPQLIIPRHPSSINIKFVICF